MHLPSRECWSQDFRPFSPLCRQTPHLSVDGIALSHHRQFCSTDPKGEALGALQRGSERSTARLCLHPGPHAPSAGSRAATSGPGENLLSAPPAGATNLHVDGWGQRARSEPPGAWCLDGPFSATPALYP